MGSFGKPTFSSKEHALRILELVSLVVHFPLLGSSCSFFLVVLSFFLVFLVITFFLLGWIEIASIMAASSHCFWSCSKNWVHWFVSDNFRSSWVKWIFCMSIVSCCAGDTFHYLTDWLDPLNIFVSNKLYRLTTCHAQHDSWTLT